MMSRPCVALPAEETWCAAKRLNEIRTTSLEVNRVRL
jgi:hypothetical protein